MTHPHTFKHMREMSIANIFDRRNREVWMDLTGGQDVTERAYVEAERIIKEHKVAPLSEAAISIMDGVIKEFESQLEK
ncbi:hypothetical protein [Desulfosporosinus sp. SB140]|uniref:hypothetical protein n=1 Tax=Desulfosporosinus paludis TaxID=3115649 RepID=UPI00388DD25A